MDTKALLSCCHLCPRDCGANRLAGDRGACGETAQLRAGLAYLHQWEEPCLVGDKGSGTVFFSGCPLGCVFCQNGDLSHRGQGKPLSTDRLSQVFLALQAKGAANINLVTGQHFLPQIRDALLEVTGRLSIPVVYNSSGYEKPQALDLLRGLIQIYLPDFKYPSPQLAARYSKAPDYPRWAKAALDAMVDQVGPPVFRADGTMLQGVLVRHLVLPGQTADSKAVLHYLHSRYGSDIYISIMNQYTPVPGLDQYPELQRPVSQAEYDEVLDYAISIGIDQGFTQEAGTVAESFIPHFDGSGL